MRISNFKKRSLSFSGIASTRIAANPSGLHTISPVTHRTQSVGMEYVGPFTFNGVRSLIGAAVLVPVIFILNQSKKTGSNSSSNAASTASGSSSSATQNTVTTSPYNSRDLWLGGIACGVALFAASNFQQFGIQYTTVGKAGFITAFCGDP